MDSWLKPLIIIGVIAVLVTVNVFEFRAKRRNDQSLAAALEQGSASEQLALRQYRQTQNIEQLLHVLVTILFAVLVALLWR
jgi:type II secretory pathway pseudopilin PulG